MEIEALSEVQEPKPLRLSNSQIETWELCRRKYQYIYRLGLDDPVGVEALFGSELIHLPLAHLYLSSREPDWPQLWKKFGEKYGIEMTIDPTYSLGLAQKSFKEYVSHYFKEDLSDFKVIAAEQFSYWAGDGVLYMSKPDLVLSSKDNGQITPLDFKTLKRINPVSHSQLNRQLVGQALSLGVREFLIHFFQLTPGSRNQAPRSTQSRHQILIEEDQAQEWKEEVEQVAREIKASDSSGIYPKSSPKSCWAFNRPCHFLSLCQSGSLRTEEMKGWKKHDRKTQSHAQLEAIPLSPEPEKGVGNGVS